MEIVQLREAKARLSALVNAERGEATTIIQHGRAAAMIVPIERARDMYPENKPSFAEWLLSIPGEFETERDMTPIWSGESRSIG